MGVGSIKMALEVSPEQEEDRLRFRPGAGYSEVRLGRCPGAEKDKQQILGDLETKACPRAHEGEQRSWRFSAELRCAGPEKRVVGGDGWQAEAPAGTGAWT